MIRRQSVGRVLALVAILTFVMPAWIVAQSDTQYFPETQQSVSGRFLQFWRDQGGLDVFGYPITPQRPEQNRDTAQTYATQWFERNRFEQHPENGAPYDVLLGRLGDDALMQQGRDWQAEGREAGPQAGCLWFDQTGHNVCNQAGSLGFRTYWETHGLNDPRLSEFAQSLALFGLPLTTPRMETNSSGDRVLTQWFERARFEWHPDNPDQFKVLLGRLGAEIDGGNGPVLPPHQGSHLNFSDPERESDGLFHSEAGFTDEQGLTFQVELAGPSDDELEQFGAEASFAIRARAATETLPILAFYDSTYTLSDWDTLASDGKDTAAPRYTTDDPTTFDRQVAQAQEAGIDALICWFYDLSDRRVDRCGQLFQQAEAAGFRVILSPVPVSPVGAALNDPDAMVQALTYLRDDYMSRDGWLRYNGAPVVVVRHVALMPGGVDAWRTIQRSVDPRHEWFWVGEGVDLGSGVDFSYLDVFDGLFVMDFTDSNDQPQQPLTVLRAYDDGLAAYNAAHGSRKPFIASFMPAYADLRPGAIPPQEAQDRSNGDYYQQSWAVARSFNPAMAILSSFNDFEYGTYIEPSDAYGDQYLQLTQAMMVGPPVDPNEDIIDNPANITIDLRLVADSVSLDRFKDGYQIDVDIDPTINTGVTHQFKNLCARAVYTVVETKTGVVEGRLKRDKVVIQSKYVYPGANNTRVLSNNAGGSRTYGLRIMGHANNSLYRVTGSWQAAFNDPAPNGGQCDN